MSQLYDGGPRRSPRDFRPPGKRPLGANGDTALVRRALNELDPIRVAADPSLSAFQDAVR